MKENGVQMWVIIAREYNEDPVIKTMLPSTWLSARRRTILVFARKGDAVDRLAVARYDIGSFFRKSWNPEKQPDQWQRLVEIVQEYDPESIALNYSSTFGLADGIAHTDYSEFMDVLPKKFKKRVTGGENLAVGWLESRIPEEMPVFAQACRIGHEIIKEAFSNAVIQPGVTTTADVQWWMREKVRSLGLRVWFHPSVSVQRAESPEHDGDFSSKPDSDIIQPGDLLHVDFGITYMGLNTDQQQHAYVLRRGETDAPESLKNALAKGNGVQDHLLDQFQNGSSGNEMLARARQAAIGEGLKPSIYTHPIGYHGHGAGPTIGLWDQQGGVPGSGDYRLRPNTAYSIELNATVFVEDWEREIRIMLEEEAFFDGDRVDYIDGRQTSFHIIRGD